MANKSFFLLLVALFIAAPAANAADLVTSVCSTTLNPRLCNDVLRADPRSSKADAKGLAFISLDIASSNAKQVGNLVASLLKSAKNTTSKEVFETCVELIQGTDETEGTVGYLDDARDALKSGDITLFMTRASAALDNPFTCDDQFEGLSPEPEELVQADKKLGDLCSIVLAAGKRLGG